MGRGVQLLDTRDPIEFAAAHLRGSVNIGLVGQYATWAGTVLSRDQPIVIVADPGAETQSAMRLGRIGFDHVAGYLDGGLRAADGRPDLIIVDRAARARARRVQARGAEPRRSSSTFAMRRSVSEKRLDGSVHIPLGHLSERIDEIPTTARCIVYCAGGYRSSIAASLLQRSGRPGQRNRRGDRRVGECWSSCPRRGSVEALSVRRSGSTFWVLRSVRAFFVFTHSTRRFAERRTKHVARELAGTRHDPTLVTAASHPVANL